MNTHKIALILSAAALTACAPEPSTEQQPSAETPVEETMSGEENTTYSRYTIAKQNRILAKQEAGETLSGEEQRFLEDNPPIEEEED